MGEQMSGLGPRLREVQSSETATAARSTRFALQRAAATHKNSEHGTLLTPQTRRVYTPNL